MIISSEIKRRVIDMVANEMPKEEIMMHLNISMDVIDTIINVYNDVIIELANYKKIKIDSSKKIKVLTKQRKFKEALKLCNNPLFNNDTLINSQKIKVLCKLRRFDEALFVCNLPQFRDSFNIQTQKIKVLIMQKRLEEALAICDEERFINYSPVQAEKVVILTKLERYQEAYDLCSNEKFISDITFINLGIKLLDKLSDSPITSADISSEEKKKEIKTKNKKSISMLNLINDNQVTLEDISNEDFSSLECFILTIAYYEKNNYPVDVIKRYIKSFSKESVVDITRIINKIKDRIAKKVKIFDIDFYVSILNEEVVSNSVDLNNEYYLKLIELFRRIYEVKASDEKPLTLERKL